MFQGRVSGVGGIISDLMQGQMDGGAKDLYPTTPGWDFPNPIEKPAPAPAPAPALAATKPTGLPLPLILGAAYLLLS
jgi:hypothetical protein